MKNKGINAIKHCRLCSYSSRSISAISVHYRKKHPLVMKQKKLRKVKVAQKSGSSDRFCPHCGYEL
jgi:hypothetical protein